MALTDKIDRPSFEYKPHTAKKVLVTLALHAGQLALVWVMATSAHHPQTQLIAGRLMMAWVLFCFLTGVIGVTLMFILSVLSDTEAAPDEPVKTTLGNSDALSTIDTVTDIVTITVLVALGFAWTAMALATTTATSWVCRALVRTSIEANNKLKAEIVAKAVGVPRNGDADAGEAASNER